MSVSDGDVHPRSSDYFITHRSSSFSAMVFPLLKCPACADTLTHPTTLTCGHTVCSKHVQSTPSQDPGPSSPTHQHQHQHQQPQLPSCPILTCFTPGGPRPLRRRRLDNLSSSSEHGTTPQHDADDESEQLIYHPPPTDLSSSRIPPPPLAMVKIPHPKPDVTLARVINIIGQFIDLSSSSSSEQVLAPALERSIVPDHAAPLSLQSSLAKQDQDITLVTASFSVNDQVDYETTNSQSLPSRASSPSTILSHSSGPASPSPLSQPQLYTDDQRSTIPGEFYSDASHDNHNHTSKFSSNASPLPRSSTLDFSASRTSPIHSPPPSSSRSDEVVGLTTSARDLSPGIETGIDIEANHASRDQAKNVDDSIDPHADAHKLELELELELDLNETKIAELTEALLPELTCEICYSLFYDPVTTPCQHTFCSKCLLRSLDHSALCPLCREELPGFAFYHDHPSNETLLSIITTLFAAQYKARQTSLIEEDRASTHLPTPIFPCTLAFPGVPLSLNIFEPRYRLMIRRCLSSGTHEFGMTMHPNPQTGDEMMFGTMLRIKSVRMSGDGRSAVETVGVWRFRILERGWLDGYMVAKIERIDDYPPEMEALMDRRPAIRSSAASISGSSTSSGSSSSTSSSSSSSFSASSHSSGASSLLRNPFARNRSSYTSSPPSSPEPPPSSTTINSQEGQVPGSPMPLPLPIHLMTMDMPTNEELVATCHAFIERMRKRVAPWIVQRVNAAYGPMPDDAATLSFWMALVLPVDDYDKAKLLPLRSARLRLRLIVHWIDAMDKQNWWHSSGCVVM